MKFITTMADTYRSRIVKKFALLPISIYYIDRKETRWLETVYLAQSYSTNYADGGWQNDRFVTATEYNYLKK
jgi:hypothetical protein